MEGFRKDSQTLEVHSLFFYEVTSHLNKYYTSIENTK